MVSKKEKKTKLKRPLATTSTDRKKKKQLDEKAKTAQDEGEEKVSEQQKKMLEEQLLKLGKLGPLQGIEELKEKRTEEQRKKDAEAVEVEDDFTIEKKTGVIYLGHVPHGFYEVQMKGFFSQFGKVVNLRLARSKKTGRSKGYAFIQFESEEVAKIVQQTMHKYILCDKILDCTYIQPEKVHERMFFNKNRSFRVRDWRKMDMLKHNAERTLGKKQKRAKTLLSLEGKKRQKLKKMGIEYEFPGYKQSAKQYTK